MPHRTLIQPDELAALLRTPDSGVLVFDCSFDLADTEAGERAFAATGHLPGAQYLHLDRDLSGAKTGRNGRHPLPDPAAFARRMAEAGVSDDTQVVAYDAMGGVYASRLWWLLRWAGHADVAVLDGGLPAWRAFGGVVETGAAPAPRAGGRFTLRTPLVPTVDYETLADNMDSGELLAVDARSNDRFRGENETLDPVAGHIPGARNRFFKDNLDAQGRFKSAAQLKAEFIAVVGTRPASQLVALCGSGVTACHNLLALEVAGLGGAALYPGSWSEWVAHPGAAVATGAETR